MHICIGFFDLLFKIKATFLCNFDIQIQNLIILNSLLNDTIPNPLQTLWSFEFA